MPSMQLQPINAQDNGHTSSHTNGAHLNGAAAAAASGPVSLANWNLSYTTHPAKVVLARDIAHVQVRVGYYT